MLNNKNTVISITAFNDPASLDKCLAAITRYNINEYPIYIFLDNKGGVSVEVENVCLNYEIAYIHYTTKHLLPTCNKLQSLYYFSNMTEVKYIFSFEDDIEISSQYFEVMQDLLISTGADIVNSMNFNKNLDDPHKNKYAEIINHMWQFLIKTDILHKLQPFVNHYITIFDEHTNKTDITTLHYLRSTLSNASYISHNLDFLAECCSNPTTGWDAALHWLLKAAGGFKYTSLTPHCRPIPRDGWNYTASIIEEGDKHLSQIEHDLHLPINWTLSTEVEKE